MNPRGLQCNVPGYQLPHHIQIATHYQSTDDELERGMCTIYRACLTCMNVASHLNTRGNEWRDCLAAITNSAPLNYDLTPFVIDKANCSSYTVTM